jgi:hypothetical protein
MITNLMLTGYGRIRRPVEPRLDPQFEPQLEPRWVPRRWHRLDPYEGSIATSTHGRHMMVGGIAHAVEQYLHTSSTETHRSPTGRPA